MWKLSPTVKWFWQRGLRKASCRKRRYSPMSKYSPVATPDDLGAWLMSLRQDFRASPGPSPGNVRERWTREIYGRIPFALFEKSGPGGAYWRMCQACLPGLTDISDRYSKTWPKRGLMFNGRCWELPTLERPTAEKGSGLWRTPSSSDGEGGVMEMRPGAAGKYKLRDQVQEINHRYWPTPRAQDGPHGPARGSLGDAVRWATPKSTVSGPDYARRNRAGSGGDDLATQCGGTLNPTWVELLMGWPENWTCIGPISHVKYCQWLMGNCHAEKTRINEVLRVLRCGHAAEEVSRTVGRPVCIREATVLLADVCQHANRPDQARVFMACAEIFETEVRGLRVQSGIAGSPRRPEYQEQRSGEHSDTMQTLSRLLAHYGPEAWKDGSWENGIPRIESGVASRVDRLKALGNGQVPAMVERVWQLMTERIRCPSCWSPRGGSKRNCLSVWRCRRCKLRVTTGDERKRNEKYCCHPGRA